MTNNIQKYTTYKPSGVEWLGDIPEHWEVKKLKFILKFSTGGTPSSLMSGLYDGDEPWVTISDMNGKYIDKTHFISKKGVKVANIPVTKKGSLLYSFKLSVGQVAFTNKDIYTNEAIATFHPQKSVNLNFWYYLLPIFVIKNANTNIYGAFLLNQDLIKNSILLSPPLSEQTRIAEFLDTKTALIDKAIGIKEKQIELLKERRQIMIHRAVTRGIDPNVKLKPSGVEWIGNIPEHWEVKRAKYLFDEINERSETGDEELLSVSHLTGVTPRSEKNVTMFQAEDYSGSKLCKAGDLVFNIMWAWMGALGVSDRTGIVSPSYAIYRQKDSNTFNTWYLEQLLTDNEYIAHYNRVSTGLHSSRLRFYSTMFFEMSIGFPTKEEQDEIVEYLKSSTVKIDSAISLKEQEIEKLKEYKSVLINSAVTGKIKVG